MYLFIFKYFVFFGSSDWFVSLVNWSLRQLVHVDVDVHLGIVFVYVCVCGCVSMFLYFLKVAYGA